MSTTSASVWQSKVVLHRGWHRLSNDDQTRPLENTRAAYIQAAQLNAAYAECDVWATRDGKMVLCHGSTFESMVSSDYYPEDTRKISKQIEELDWEEIKEFKLHDGSRPVLLSTVLDDLMGTNTRLAVELKCSRLALPLAKYLLQTPELASAIGFVMGFSADSVVILRGVLCNHAALSKMRVLWLVDNPTVPYLTEDKNEGETTFNFLEHNVTQFLQAQSSYQSLLTVGFHGIYIQYRPGLTPSHISSMRQELSTLIGSALSDIFVGIWSDGGLDPEFDTPASLVRWTEIADGVNTDCMYMKTITDIPSVLS